jgi:hypothetical protein
LFWVALLSTMRSGSSAVYGTPLDRTAEAGVKDVEPVGTSLFEHASAPPRIDATISVESVAVRM